VIDPNLDKPQKAKNNNQNSNNLQITMMKIKNQDRIKSLCSG
jgi:hypothetical protein